MAVRKARERPVYTYTLSSIVWSNIRKYQYLMHMSDIQLAEIIGVCVRTLTAYDKTPEVLTLEKVQKFIEETGLDAEILLKT